MFSTATPLSGDVPPFCTENKVTCAGSGSEVVSQLPNSDITSGGGFSNVAPTPSWQLSQVQAYLNSGALIPPVTEFNSSGRGMYIIFYLYFSNLTFSIKLILMLLLLLIIS